MKSVIYISLVCFIIFGCLETFEPEVGSYEKTLIIDGLFSDSKSPSRVILSRSFDFSENEGELISGSTVVIEDDDGGSTILKEISNGVYESDPEEYQGQIGRSYRLLVTSPDGNQFESGWEVMNESPPR